MLREEQALHGILAAEHADVGDEHGAGDVGHAADHDGEQLGARHRREVGLDQQRRLRLAEENVGRSAQALRAGEPHRFRHQPGEDVDDLLQQPQVEEQRGERGKKDDRRQDIEREKIAERFRVR